MLWIVKEIVVLLFNLASKSVEFVSTCGSANDVVPTLPSFFHPRSCERWGWHIMKVHGSKRWGFNHHWNPDLGTQTRMPGSPRKNSKSGFGTFGCFHKWWYPQIIHFNRVFHYKTIHFGVPLFFGNTHFNHFFFFLCMEYNNYILNNYRLSFQFERNYWKGFMPSPPHENMAQVFQVFFFFSLVPGAWSISSTHLHPSARGQVGGIGFLCCEFGWENERPGKRYE